MSFLSDLEAELGKAEDAIKAKFSDVAKADIGKLVEEVKSVLTTAEAAALAAVEQSAPASAPEVRKALDAVAAEVLAVLGAHLVP